MSKDQPAPEDIVLALRKSLSMLRARYPLRRLFLYGSVARNEATGQSDVDLLADIEPSVGLRFVDLAEDLEKILGRPVDLVTERSLTQRYREAIKRECIDVEA